MDHCVMYIMNKICLGTKPIQELTSASHSYLATFVHAMSVKSLIL